MALTGKQARHLRSLAHALKPVVMVGDKGLTAEVERATSEALESHELIKVKIDGDRDDVKEAAAHLAEACGAEVAQIIGKTVALYKARSKKPTIRLPRAEEGA